MLQSFNTILPQSCPLQMIDGFLQYNLVFVITVAAFYTFHRIVLSYSWDATGHSPGGKSTLLVTSSCPTIRIVGLKLYQPLRNTNPSIHSFVKGQALLAGQDVSANTSLNVRFCCNTGSAIRCWCGNLSYSLFAFMTSSFKFQFMSPVGCFHI